MIWLKLFFVFLLTQLSFSCVFTKSDIEKALIKEIKQKFPQYLNCDITAEARIDKFLEKKLAGLTAENCSIKVNISNDSELTNLFYARVNLLDDNKIKEVLRIQFKIAIFKEVYHAKTDYAAGSQISTDQFYLKKINITLYDQDIASPGYDFKDKFLANRLKADEPLSAWKIKRQPVVSPGDKITVTFISDNVVLKIQAKALQLGHIGDSIRVITANNKVFKAKITGPGKYLVYL